MTDQATAILYEITNRVLVERCQEGFYLHGEDVFIEEFHKSWLMCEKPYIEATLDALFEAHHHAATLLLEHGIDDLMFEDTAFGYARDIRDMLCETRIPEAKTAIWKGTRHFYESTEDSYVCFPGALPQDEDPAKGRILNEVIPGSTNPYSVDVDWDYDSMEQAQGTMSRPPIQMPLADDGGNYQEMWFNLDDVHGHNGLFILLPAKPDSTDPDDQIDDQYHALITYTRQYDFKRLFACQPRSWASNH